MDKYLLFAGSAYYPLGGWYDFKKSSNSIDDLKELINKDRDDNKYGSWDFWHIIDIETGECVEHHGFTCYISGDPNDPNED